MTDKSKFNTGDEMKRQPDETGKMDRSEDLTDSPRDRERLASDEAVLDLPELSDIPGQENISVPPLGELGDTTASSDDEEDLV